MKVFLISPSVVQHAIAVPFYIKGGTECLVDPKWNSMTFCKVAYILIEARKVYLHGCDLIQVENLKYLEYPEP